MEVAPARNFSSTMVRKRAEEGEGREEKGAVMGSTVGLTVYMQQGG